MTINADCNNNKLEVSMTSNGLEVTSAAPASEIAETVTSDRTTADVGNSRSGTSSRSASTSPPPNTIIAAAANHRASPKKRTAITNSSSTKSPPKSATTVQRHQSMPVATSEGVQQVVTGKAGKPASMMMAPSRPISSITANHHHHHPTANHVSTTLPPLDNCDSIFAIVSLPAAANRANEVNSNGPHLTSKISPPISSPPSLPPLVKDHQHQQPQQKRKSLVSSSSPTPPPLSSPLLPIDWKSQLNYELTMYQQMLANQSHRSPLLKKAVNRTNNSNSSKQPSSHQSSYHQHYPNHHPRQQTPNSKPVSNNRQSQSSQPHHNPRTSTSPLKSPTTTTTTPTTVTSNGSTTDLTLDDTFSWTNTAAESRQLSPTNTTSPSSTTATTNTSYASPPILATNSAFTSPSEKNGQPHPPPSDVNTRSGRNGGVEATTLGVRTTTPYERLLYAMENDKTWAKEVAFGRRIGLYRFKGDIGNGNFSQVKIAIHSLTKEKVAVKILDKARLDAKTQRMLAREIRTMETLHHPNLIRIFEVIETLSKHYIVMELAPGGELFQVISLQGRLSEAEGRFYFSQILAAIEHMHQHNLIHRDIKAENVFFSDPYTVKVGDFGFSTRISSQDELLSTFCGSPPYAAPELFRDESYRGPFVDYWALGVLLYFIVTGTMPFRAQTIVALKKLILDGRYDVPAYVSVECCQLIAGFLQPVPAKRYSLEAARGTRWLSGRGGAASLISSKGSGGSVAKYDLKTSYGRLLRSRRLAIAERRNTLSEFSTAEYDFTQSGSSAGKSRSNRFSLVEPTDTSRRSSPAETSPTEKFPPPSSGEKSSGSASLTQPSTPAAVTTKILSDEERQTFRQLLTLGIDDTVIVQHLERGSISAIVGTFRIILHRAIQESAMAAAAAAARSSAQTESRKEASRGGLATSNGHLGRSTSIQVAAFDRFWANYARKSAGTQGKTAVVPNGQLKTSKKQQPLSITPGPRQATVRQMIRSPPPLSTDHKTVVDKVSKRTSADNPLTSVVEDPRSETCSSGTPKDSVVKRNSSSKFSKMMAAMVIANSKHHQNGSQKGTPSSANGRLANGVAKMTITENGGFHPHDHSDHHLVKAPKRELEHIVTVVAEAETPKVESNQKEERQKVHRQKSSSSKDSSDGVTLTVVENGGTTLSGTEKLANGHLLTSTAANHQIHPHHHHHHLSSANSGRLSRSWRTIKSLVTDNTICGTNIAPITAGAGPQSLPCNGHSQDRRSPSSNAHPSRASTPSSSTSPNGKIPHHVLHKTTTLQIAVPATVNSGASTLLWSPGSGKLLGSPLRRSQTTPNVSTCYRNHLLSSSTSTSSQKKYSAANGRCTIF